MQQKLLTIAVAAALGLGTTGYVNAADTEGVAAYITNKVVDLRLVNPQEGTNGTTIFVVGGAAVGNGTTDSSITLNNNTIPFAGKQGEWDTTGAVIPAGNEPDDPMQSCVSGNTQGVDDEDFQDVTPVPGATVCPGDTLLGNVFTPVPVYEDIARSDAQLIGGTAPLPGGLPDDGTVDGDDFEVVAECHRSGTDETKFASSNTDSLVLAQEITIGNTPTQFLEWRGEFTGEASAELSAGQSSNSSAVAKNTLTFSIDGPLGSLDCDVQDVTLNATAFGPGPDSDSDAVPPDEIIVCDAEEFGPGEQFQPDVVYTITASIAAETTCALQPEPNGGDDYVCYKAFGEFLREDDVNLVDQFDPVNDDGTVDGTNVDVIKPKMFCNPAVKTSVDGLAVPLPDEFPTATTPHLAAYAIDEASGEPSHQRQDVLVFNQFHPNGLAVRTLDVEELFVPSGKSLDPAAPPADPGFAINHFKCYQVSADRFSADITVIDQFIDPDFTNDPALAKGLRIVRPTKLCNPVSKNGSPLVPDPETGIVPHLMCYSVWPARGEEPNERVDVVSANQFRTEELALKRELEFCAESTKLDDMQP